MKQKLTLIGSVGLVLVLAGLALMAACAPAPAPAPEKVWTLKIQNYTVPGRLDAQWVVPEKFIELIKQHTNGRVDCSLHPVGEFVGAREVWSAVGTGTVGGGCTLDLYQGGTHPEFSFDIGALWTIDEWFGMMHAGALDIMSRQALKDNIRIVGYFPLLNYYAMSMRREHVKTLEDLKGKKIRSMGGATKTFLERAGAGIVTLPMSEVPSALETGVVDGIHTGMAGLYAMNLWDVAPYFTWTRSGTCGFIFLLNEDIYQEFPADVKAGIDAAQEELEVWYREWDADFWKEIVPDVEPKGIKWYALPPDEAKRWRELLTEASVSWVLERSPEVGKELFEIVEKVTGRKVM